MISPSTNVFITFVDSCIRWEVHNFKSSLVTRKNNVVLIKLHKNQQRDEISVAESMLKKPASLFYKPNFFSFSSATDE